MRTGPINELAQKQSKEETDELSPTIKQLKEEKDDLIGG